MHAISVKFARVGFALLLLLSAMVSNPSFAEDRPLPKNGILGTFKPSLLPKFVIDENLVRAGAGVQIRNQKNLIVQTSALSGPDVKILYTKNNQGQVERIWILDDEEFQRIRSGGNPAFPGVKTPPVKSN
ncbi:hypothetical protein AAKU67_003348 [Oxalobacteraceae bacterium GrIS 2.11]